jgi:hypothetical protein
LVPAVPGCRSRHRRSPSPPTPLAHRSGRSGFSASAPCSLLPSQGETPPSGEGSLGGTRVGDEVSSSQGRGCGAQVAVTGLDFGGLRAALPRPAPAATGAGNAGTRSTRRAMIWPRWKSGRRLPPLARPGPRR